MLTAFRTILLIVLFIAFICSMASNDEHKELAQRGLAICIASMISFIATFFL